MIGAVRIKKIEAHKIVALLDIKIVTLWYCFALEQGQNRARSCSCRDEFL